MPLASRSTARDRCRRARYAYPLRNRAPPAHARQRVQGKIDLGVRALNTFLSCCRGQRMGIFSGSGVGKSVLLSMIARYTAADAIVIGLIGERGREVQEFIEDDLGPEGLARSVVVVATSDESPLMRRQAAFLTLAVAEFLRDSERDVLCLIDSVTRFATAQREIGLSAGEPPTTKGYTPTVFAELPKLLERAGPGTGKGSITGLFTVLVEGDDQNEPIADACRAILDGHIVLDRAIAERGRYPAIDILRSISRTMPQCNSADENRLVAAARAHIATYENMAELIRLGAYRAGSDAGVDAAIRYYPALEAFLAQPKNERADLAAGYAALAAILGNARMSALDSLVRLHRWQLDERRRRLADLDQLAAKLNDDIIRLAEEEAREQAAASASLEAARVLWRICAPADRAATQDRAVARFGPAADRRGARGLERSLSGGEALRDRRRQPRGAAPPSSRPDPAARARRDRQRRLPPPRTHRRVTRIRLAIRRGVAFPPVAERRIARWRRRRCRRADHGPRWRCGKSLSPRVAAAEASGAWLRSTTSRRAPRTMPSSWNAPKRLSSASMTKRAPSSLAGSAPPRRGRRR